MTANYIFFFLCNQCAKTAQNAKENVVSTLSSRQRTRGAWAYNIESSATRFQGALTKRKTTVALL